MDVLVLIPAYEPGEGLAAYADQLVQQGFGRIVVVDDGSGKRFGPVFDALAAKPFCTVLHHDVNRGKGAAIKTGLSFIQREYPDAVGVVTADSDGQHAPEDCLRLAEALTNRKGSLQNPAGQSPRLRQGSGVASRDRRGRHGVPSLPDAAEASQLAQTIRQSNRPTIFLGCRTFSLKATPFRSWVGNRWASATFALIHGRWLPDTQTGLRAFPLSLLPFMLDVKGDRFEYEMGVLIAAARKGLPMETVPIRTIYENGNVGTHFRPLQDTLRINRLVFADFFRFAGVSLASFALDQALAWGFASALAAAGVTRTGAIWASGFAARFLSAVFNFSLNRTYVFRSGVGLGAAAWRYALLCVAVIVLSNAGVTGLVLLGVPRGLAKLLCDTFLYFAGYRIQAKMIFGVRG